MNCCLECFFPSAEFTLYFLARQLPKVASSFLFTELRVGTWRLVEYHQRGKRLTCYRIAHYTWRSFHEESKGRSRLGLARLKSKLAMCPSLHHRNQRAVICVPLNSSSDDFTTLLCLKTSRITFESLRLKRSFRTASVILKSTPIFQICEPKWCRINNASYVEGVPVLFTVSGVLSLDSFTNWFLQVSQRCVFA